MDTKGPLGIFDQVALAIISQRELQPMFAAIARAAREIIQGQWSFIAVGQPENPIFTDMAYSSSVDAPECLVESGQKMQPDHLAIYRYMLTRQDPLVVEDFVQDSHHAPLPMGHFTIKNLLGMPLRNRDGQGIGVLLVANKPERFSEDDIHGIATLARLAGIAIENTTLFQQQAKAKDALEDLVAERTARLLATNMRLEELIKELKTIDHLKSNFIATISHELRTPLAVVLGFGSELLDQAVGPLTPEQHESVLQMVDNAKRLLKIVNNLIDYSQLAAGTLRVYPQASSVREAVNSALEILKPSLEGKHQHLTQTLPEDLPLVYADPQRLHQILYELLENANKFTPEGGSILVAAHPQGHRVVIEISDTGVGISEEVRRHLFQPFFQGEAAATRTQGGTGIGLAITKQLIELHGGTIDVRPRERGTTFRFSLPAYTSVETLAPPG